MSVSDKAIRPKDYAKLTNTEVEAKTVDCPTCPVNMLCEAGEGGVGYVCSECGSTALGVESTNLAKTQNMYYLDCSKQHFSRVAGVLEKCDLCSGKIMKTEVNGIPPTLYLIRTVYAKVPIDERRRAFEQRRVEYEAHERARAENPDRVR